MKLDVINNEGRIVKLLVNSLQYPGEHEVVWNGMDNSGKDLPSGTYYYCLYEDDNKICRKMIKMKTSTDN